MARSETSGGSPALDLWVVLARAFDSVGRHASAQVARHHLAGAEFGVLEILYHKGRLPVCQVQRRILLQSGSTTYVIDKLARRGLVRRIPNPDDRRGTLLELTAAGKRMIARIFPEHRATLCAAMAALGPKEQRVATKLLRRLGLGATERLSKE